MVQPTNANKDTPLPQNRETTPIYMPNITVDCVILGFYDKHIMVLLHKDKNTEKRMLPWSFVKKNESVNETALNIIEEKTGLQDAYMKQYHLFGEHYEQPAKDSAIAAKINSKESRMSQWEHQRCLSLAYYVLVKYDEVAIDPEKKENTEWFPINELPEIYEDHKKQIAAVINIIKQQIGFIPLGFQLLPRKFTMPELRTIYEVILGKDLDRRNFQRKILASGIIIPLNETRKTGAHKSPNLYIFDHEKYETARTFGLQLISPKF